jgi:hypothetical protein
VFRQNGFQKSYFDILYVIFENSSCRAVLMTLWSAQPPTLFSVVASTLLYGTLLKGAQA